MQDRDVAILVVSCDAYQDLWEPFFRCFFKYWPDCPYPIFLGSNFAAYRDGGVSPLVVGDDVDYSSNLLSMLSRIDATWVIVWVEDRVLSAPVETARLVGIFDTAQEKGAGFVKLIASHPYAITDDRSQEIGEIRKGNNYRVCMTVGLWNKETLLKLLRPGETAWQIERAGSRRSNASDKGFYALSYGWRHRPPIEDVHLIIKGRLLRDTREFLAREGLIEYMKKRTAQTRTASLYVKAYLRLKDSVAFLEWIWVRFGVKFSQNRLENNASH